MRGKRGGAASSAGTPLAADAFAMQLRTTNIGNACCVALDIDFTSPHANGGSACSPPGAAAAVRGVDNALVVAVEPILDFRFNGLEADEIVPGSQLHVRGIGVHGWSIGVHGLDGRGEFESEAALRTVFARFGHLVQVSGVSVHSLTQSSQGCAGPQL